MPKLNRSVVKIAARSLSHVILTQASTAALHAAVAPQTESAEEAVKVGGFAIGSVIWWQTTSLVDSSVDKVAEWRRVRKLENMVVRAA